MARLVALADSLDARADEETTVRRAAGRTQERPLAVAGCRPREVVVMRALPGLGDFLCVTPALRALRSALPAARVTLLGLAGTRPLVDRYRHLVDAFLEFPGFPGLPEAPANVRALPEFLRAVQGRFDLALQMHGSGVVSNTFVQLLGARVSAGCYATPLACPDPATFMPYPAGLAEPQVYLALLASLGIAGRGEQLEFPIAAHEQAELDAVLRGLAVADDAALALVHVGAAEARRRVEPWVLGRVVDGLAARGLEPALTGSCGDAALAESVRAHVRCRPLDLVGRTSLGTLGALVRRARLVIAGDTGVSHLASALGTASVIVFLASAPQRWAPLDRQLHRVVDGRSAPAGAAAILAEVDAVLAATGVAHA